MEEIRKIIRLLVQEELKNKKDELLTEPDEPEGREEAEASAGGVAGVAVPLGAGPNYPLKTRRKPSQRTPLETTAAAFGGSKLPKNKK